MNQSTHLKSRILSKHVSRSLMFISNQGPMYEWNHIHKCKNLYLEEAPHDGGQHDHSPGKTFIVRRNPLR